MRTMDNLRKICILLFIILHFNQTSVFATNTFFTEELLSTEPEATLLQNATSFNSTLDSVYSDTIEYSVFADVTTIPWDLSASTIQQFNSISDDFAKVLSTDAQVTSPSPVPIMPATAVLVTTDQSTWIDTSTNTNGSPSSLSSGVTSPSSINVTLMLLASIIGVTGLALIVLTYSFTVIFSACERSKKRDGNEVTRSSDIKLFSLSALQSQPIQKTATDCYLVSNITHSQSPDLDHSRSSAHVYHSVDTLNRDQNISTMNHQTLEDSSGPVYERQIRENIPQSGQLSFINELEKLYEEPRDTNTTMYSNSPGPLSLSSRTPKPRPTVNEFPRPPPLPLISDYSYADVLP